MKFIGKLLLTLLLLLVLVIVLLYVLLQTTWASGWISRWISDNSEYHLSLGKINHSLSSPTEISFSDVRLALANQPEILSAGDVTLGLSWRQITEPRYFDRLVLRDGSLNLTSPARPLPIKADLLQLSNMRLISNKDSWKINAQRVNAGIQPWLPSEQHLLGNNAQFQLSAGELTLNDIPASNVLVQGEIREDRLFLNDIGADFARGQLTGNASRAPDGSWLVDNLRLSSIRMQTSQTLSAFWKDFEQLPKVKINRADLIDARLQGQDWAFNDLDLTLQNITFSQGDWQTDDGSLAFNASDLINGNLHFSDPIVDMSFSQKGIEIKQLSTRWEGGLLRTTGNWTRENHRLQLNELAVAALEYTLPENWRALWMETLPNWLAEVGISRLSTNRNLVIDITPDFPFQLTALDGYGSNLLLARNHKWGVWAGKLNLNASDATFNKVDVRRPSLTLEANDGQITFSELSAFTQKGLLEASVNISQQPQRSFSTTLNGRSVPINILQNWGWPELPLQGEGNLQLNLRGQVAADTAFKSTLRGTLTATTAEGQHVTQQMNNGVVAGATAP